MSKKKIIICTCSLLIVIIIAFIITNSLNAKVDDWQYSSFQATFNEMRETIYIAGGIVLAVIAYNALLSISNLIKAKKLNNIKRKRLGLIISTFSLLIIINCLIILKELSHIVNDSTFFLLIPVILQIILVITTFIYSVKNKILSGKIYGISNVVILLIIIIGVNIISGGARGVVCDSAGQINSIGSLNGSTVQSFKTAESYLGFSTGGAKDVNNFRENIKNNYLPISTDITYEGLFYDYNFDTGIKEESKELFSPSYSYAVSKDPFSNKNEYYLSVGLNSNIKESYFVRKKLNLVVVLDISGSMSSSFNSYYYDNLNMTKETNKDNNKSKMQIANESVNILLDQLNEDDRFGMVLFDDNAYTAKPIGQVSKTSMSDIKSHILEIESQGGTNFEAGYTEGTKLFEKYLENNQDEYENRIIFLTDAMPNIGYTDKEDLLSLTEKNANNNIYTTFIGIGVDFNTEIIDTITKVKGANYYSVHNSNEFKTRMGEQFEYMVTPLVFDLNLNLKSDAYAIEAVYGSPEADKSTGNIMYVNTLFPSSSTDTGEVKGGLVLLKLTKNSNSSEDMSLNVSYTDRNGKQYSNAQNITIENKEKEYYSNTGIRKGIALSRYANILKNWIMYEQTQNNDFAIKQNIGINDFNYSKEQIKMFLGENERQSTNLSVSGNYKETFTNFKNYLQNEIAAIGDETMNQEIDVLNFLINK